ncbi:hypothetical protein [Microbacterium invictum]|uniref:O-antigen polymerase n=1 Tax=Microbacterium invictum TaxID=515415 RepID=A0ABZ0VA89_9MICO|nr:hypothetical protein [Microbacterium invictum]WQB69798.1 hypothetical protein T9R20_14010 [Microbacterium invictum]
MFILGGVFSACAFFPAVVSSFANVRVTIVIVAFLVVAMTVYGRTSSATYVLMLLTLFLVILIGSLISTQLADATGDPLVATNAQRLFVVTPLLFVAGVGTGLRLDWARPLGLAYLFLAFAASGLAIVEASVGRSLLGRDLELAEMSREGDIRAIVASEHSLVLGTLLALAIPICLILPKGLRLPAATLLVLGVAATGSRGPLLVGLVFAIVSLFRSVTASVARHSRILTLTAVVGLGVLAYLSSFVWTNVVEGSTGSEYSANYRWAIYATVPDLLISQPLGYGLGTFPQGVWLVESRAFGVKDIVLTLDSELVYSAFTLGWIGLGLVSGALIVSILAVRHSPIVGLTATMCSVLGLSIALHAWDGLGAMWVLLVGMSSAILLKGRQMNEPHMRSETLDALRPSS